MEKSHLALVAPTTVNGTVDKAGPPKRRRNAEVRSREYLTDAEVNRLISAAGENRNGHRDATMILVAYRHGLRAGELVTLRWDAIDFTHGRLHVSRLNPQEHNQHTVRYTELALARLIGLARLVLVTSIISQDVPKSS
jgi:integrase